MNKRKHIVAKPVRGTKQKSYKRKIYAELCYFYPQYKLEEVQGMPARDVNLLLKVAREQEAVRFYNLVQIVASPHTKKGQGVKQLSNHFKKIAGI